MLRVILILLLLVSPAFADYQSTITGRSPVFYCRLGEASGTNADNIGSAASDGTYTPNSGGAWTGTNNTQGQTGALSGDADTAIRLGGTGYIACPDHASYNVGSNLTVECWVKFSGLAAQGYPACQYRNVGTNNRAWLIVANTSGTFTIFISDDGTSGAGHRKNYTTSVTFGDGNWHHFAFTFASGTLKLYKDGTEDTTPTKTNDDVITAVFNTAVDVTLGASSNATRDNFFVGYLDEVAIYGTALSGSDIAANYAAGTSAGGGIPRVIHHMRQQGFALFNGSPWQLRWEVECIPKGVLFYGSSGELSPFAGATIAEWAGKLDETPPDVMAGVKRRHVVIREQLIHFVACFTGPGIPYPSHGSPAFDFDADGDGDVDQSDFGVWQRMLKL